MSLTSIMKKLLLPIFVSLLLISSFSNAKITSYDERFTLLCEIEDSTGFDWSNGNWHRTNFKAGQKYIIKKQDDEKSVDAKDYDRDKVKNQLCSWGQEGEYKSGGYAASRDGCYLIKELGEESNQGNFRTCREFWNSYEGSWKLDTIHCPVGLIIPQMTFKPNGLIHLYKSGSLEANPKGDKESNIPPDYKDSMYLSFGRCSTL